MILEVICKMSRDSLRFLVLNSVSIDDIISIQPNLKGWKLELKDGRTINC